MLRRKSSEHTTQKKRLFHKQFVWQRRKVRVCSFHIFIKRIMKRHITHRGCILNNYMKTFIALRGYKLKIHINLHLQSIEAKKKRSKDRKTSKFEPNSKVSSTSLYNLHLNLGTPPPLYGWRFYWDRLSSQRLHGGYETDVQTLHNVMRIIAAQYTRWVQRTMYRILSRAVNRLFAIILIFFFSSAYTSTTRFSEFLFI